MDSKSFFDKLTGGIKPNEEPVSFSEGALLGVDYPQTQADERVSLAANGEDEAPVSLVASKTALPSRPQKLAVDSEPAEKPELEKSVWPETETEGQLTVDIFDNSDYIVIQSAVAGVDPENLEVSFADDMVTIRGRRERMAEAKEENYYYRELYWGTFSRSVVLPEEVDVEKAEATLRNGILTVRLPKKVKSRQQKIKVKVV